MIKNVLVFNYNPPFPQDEVNLVNNKAIVQPFAIPASAFLFTIDDNGTKGSTEINATPILLVLSMPLSERFHVFTGSGYYLMRSILDYNGHVKSNGYNLGWMVAASYIQPLSKKFGLAYEAKWMNASGTNDRTLSAQVQIVWKIQ